MALEYSFLISTKIEIEILEEFLTEKTAFFRKESLAIGGFVYRLGEPLNFHIHLVFRENQEMYYYEKCIDETFYSKNLSTDLTIRLINNCDYDQQEKAIYDLIIFLLKAYESDCILRNLDQYMVFLRIDGEYIKGEYAKETLFKNIGDVRINENLDSIRKLVESKNIDKNDLVSIVDAFQIASGQKYAISKTKELLEYLRLGQQIRIIGTDDKIIMDNPECLRQTILHIDKYVDIKNESELSSYFD